jgi:hypothetical protein
MVWRNYEARQSGDCEVRHDGKTLRAHYDIGIVETGRSRVFAGHFVRLTLSDGEQITGEDDRSLRGALWRLAREVSAVGLTINCVGLSAKFSESGLSVDSGRGYWGRHQRPMHMMDATPVERVPNDDVDNLDSTIIEAVSGIQIRLT